MTNATIYDFVEELQKLNPEQKSSIQVRNFETMTYAGENPANLKVPEPFAWDEENGGFSDLAALEAAGMQPLFQVFFVRAEKA